jgi:hypothetical protein
MLNPDFEVSRLRQTLIIKGATQEEAQQIADLAMEDINSAISMLVDEALNQAREAVASIGADDIPDQDIVSQITAAKVGGDYSIITTSGMTDFTLPPFPMLPSLLKNAKVAKDGSLYKRIPIKKTSVTSLSSVQSSMNRSNLEAVEQRNTSRQEARDNSVGVNLVNLSKAKAIASRRSRGASSADGEVEFRTASSKQSSSNSWVLPEKKMDIGPLLNDITMQLNNDINSTVLNIVADYERVL